ncbi:MAG: sulfotransferase [Myxococcota bacterium]
MSWIRAARRSADPVIGERLRASWWKGAVRRIGGVRPSPALVIDKLPLNLLRLDVLVRAFPDAPVVLVVRDPRDAVVSSFLQDFHLNGAMAQLTDLTRAARLYDRAMATWRRAAPANGIVLRYESLVADPQGTWRPVVEQLGLLWDAAILGPRHQGDRSIRTPSYAAIRKPLYRRSIGRWQGYAEWLAEAAPFLDPWIEHFGYAPTASTV